MFTLQAGWPLPQEAVGEILAAGAIQSASLFRIVRSLLSASTPKPMGCCRRLPASQERVGLIKWRFHLSEPGGASWETIQRTFGRSLRVSINSFTNAS